MGKILIPDNVHNFFNFLLREIYLNFQGLIISSFFMELNGSLNGPFVVYLTQTVHLNHGKR